MMLKLFSIVLLFIAISQVNSELSDYEDSSEESKASIYSKFGEVITELDHSNFAKTIHCRNNLKNCTSFLIQFYNSELEISRNDAIIYILSAAFVNSWKHLVQVGVVDCAYPRNQELCDVHGFKYYPIFKYFGRMSETENQGTTLPEFTNGIELLQELSAQINAEYAEELYKDWPIFTPLPDFYNDSDQIWKYSNGYKEIMLIFVEEANEPLGMSLFIEAHKAARGLNARQLPVRRVLKGHDYDRLFQIDEYPSAGTMTERMMRGERDCSDTDAMKRDSIFKDTMTRMGFNFKPAYFEEQINDHGKIISRCTNHTKNFRFNRSAPIKQIKLNVNGEGSEIEINRFQPSIGMTLEQIQENMLAKA